MLLFTEQKASDYGMIIPPCEEELIGRCNIIFGLKDHVGEEKRQTASSLVQLRAVSTVRGIPPVRGIFPIHST